MAIASAALCEGAVLNEELIVLELPDMQQALQYHNISFPMSSHLKDEKSL
jgi:hypothetical protein